MRSLKINSTRIISIGKDGRETTDIRLKHLIFIGIFIIALHPMRVSAYDEWEWEAGNLYWVKVRAKHVCQYKCKILHDKLVAAREEHAVVDGLYMGKPHRWIERRIYSGPPGKRYVVGAQMLDPSVLITANELYRPVTVYACRNGDWEGKSSRPSLKWNLEGVAD